jgi:uncharacterized cupin superfamily protein
MANTIRIKKRSASGADGSPSSLASSELAFNESDLRLYYGFGDNGSAVATSIITIGGSGAFFSKTDAKAANVVLAGPTTGSDANPTFRALVAADIPSIAHTKISDFDSGVRANRLDQMSAPTGNVDINTNKLTNVTDPTSAQDAATKAYVDAVKTGLDVKDSVKVATTANITLSGTQTIDGVAVSADERVLVKDQSTGSENGIYDCKAGAWARSSDFDENSEVTSGAFVFVEQGTASADAGYVLTTDGTITVGTTALSFTQFSGAGQITAGDGLQKTGNSLSADLKSNGGIVIESAELAIDLAASSITGSLPVSKLASVTSTAAELNILDGANVTTTELNIIDGDTSATSTTLATADRMVMNDAGTMKQVALSDLVTFLADGGTSSFAVDGGTY